MTRLARIATLGVVTVLIAATGLWFVTHERQGTSVTAYFGNVIGVYPGSDVRVLGLKVGTIDAVVPRGRQVRVDMTIEPGVDIPVAASAVVVAPTLVSDRYVQFTPVYRGGPKLASGAVVPIERTAVPIELDDAVRSLDGLVTALGPDGADRDGALSGLLETGSRTLEGNGELIAGTLAKLADAADTLTRSRANVFGTVDGLARFTRTLAESDARLRDFSGRLADVTGFLADDRADLGRAVKALAGALTEVHGFVAGNRTRLTSTVDDLADVAGALVEQRAALAEVLDVFPVAVSNGVNTYDASSGSLQVRGDLNELASPPVLMLCQVLRHVPPHQVPEDVAVACERVAPFLDGMLKLPSVERVLGAVTHGDPPPLPLPMTDVVEPAGPGGGR